MNPIVPSTPGGPNPRATRAQISALVGDFGRILVMHSARRLVRHAHKEHQAIVHLAGPPATWVVNEMPLTLSPGEALLLNPWDRHGKSASQAPVLMMSFLVGDGWIRARHGDSDREYRFGQSILTLGDRTAAVAHQLSAAMLEHPNMCRDALRERYESLIDDIVRLPLVAQAPSKPMDARVRRALDTMLAGRETVLNVSHLSERASMSRSRFFALFRNEVGATPQHVIDALRLEYAIEHLANHSEPIGNIAFDLGFSTSSHFSRFFVQHLGSTPSEYRRRMLPQRHEKIDHTSGT